MDWLAFLPLLVLIIIGCFLLLIIHFIRCCFVLKMYVQLFRQAAPVVVTSATHTAPGGYPVTQMPATNYQPGVYATPYPAQTTGPTMTPHGNVTVQMPMPMPGVNPTMPGGQPYGAPYPPMPQPGAGVANMNPPSYDMAMASAGPSVMPGGYEKQMPYNPNYAQ